MRILLITFFLLTSILFANVGKITAIKGDATVLREAKNITLSLGFILKEKDKITTSKDARLQIVFNDKTIISLGKSSTFDINEYFYDEAKPKDTKASFKVARGIFKSITGRIGKINPNKFKLKTKSSAIGIRGTIFLGQVPPSGPEVIACTQGSIVVETPEGVVEVLAGEVTSIVPGQPPLPPKKGTASQINKLEGDSGAPENEPESGEGESPIGDTPQPNDFPTTSPELPIDPFEPIVPNDPFENTATNLGIHTLTFPAGSTNDFADVTTNYIDYSLLTNSVYSDIFGPGWVKEIKNKLLTDSATYSLSLDPSVEDDGISWGFWGAEPTLAVDMYVVKGAWVKGKNLVSDLSTLSGTANYSGKIMGYYENGTFISPETSTIDLYFDFGANKANVNININMGNDSLSIEDGTYSASGSQYTIKQGLNAFTGSMFDENKLTAGVGHIDPTSGNEADIVYKAKEL